MWQHGHVYNTSFTIIHEETTTLVHESLISATCFNVDTCTTNDEQCDTCQLRHMYDYVQYDMCRPTIEKSTTQMCHPGHLYNRKRYSARRLSVNTCVLKTCTVGLVTNYDTFTIKIDTV